MKLVIGTRRPRIQIYARGLWKRREERKMPRGFALTMLSKEILAESVYSGKKRLCKVRSVVCTSVVVSVSIMLSNKFADLRVTGISAVQECVVVIPRRVILLTYHRVAIKVVPGRSMCCEAVIKQVIIASPSKDT